jgi:hypothetical protein
MLYAAVCVCDVLTWRSEGQRGMYLNPKSQDNLQEFTSLHTGLETILLILILYMYSNFNRHKKRKQIDAEVSKLRRS